MSTDHPPHARRPEPSLSFARLVTPTGDVVRDAIYLFNARAPGVTAETKNASKDFLMTDDESLCYCDAIMTMTMMIMD